MQKYDEDFYQVMAKHYLNESRWTKLRMSNVKKMVQPLEGDKILDLGCGMGATSHFLALEGADVTGVDLSAKAIEKARELFGDNNRIKFLKRDVSDLSDFQDEIFGKAVATDLVEHINQNVFEKMVSEALRVLNKNGTLSIYTPNPEHVIERFKANNFILKQNPTHIDIKSMSRICQTLESSGFKIDMAYYTQSFIPIFKSLEILMKDIPKIGNYFRYRICVRGKKVV
ncbi:MAG: class I SAM-dependent methyltransferase [Candidatus Hodarchaeales archaeon]|jgi:cyclopropane fatty-acyl-phospholipid synthase-like methyltransferase